MRCRCALAVLTHFVSSHVALSRHLRDWQSQVPPPPRFRCRFVSVDSIAIWVRSCDCRERGLLKHTGKDCEPTVKRSTRKNWYRWHEDPRRQNLQR